MSIEKVINIITALAGSIAAIAACASAFLALEAIGVARRASQEAADAARANTIQQHMVAYLSEFAKLINTETTPFLKETYYNLYMKDRLQARIVAGMLVSLVDLMIKNNDTSTTWAL